MRSLPLGQHTPLRPLALASAFSVLLLAACGGGGDSGDKPSTAVKSTFSGTAATGAALAGATVRIQCAVGTGTVTAGDNGSYTVSIDNATLPCVARAVSSDGTTTLYALVDPAGGTAQTLNINPVTDLVAAKVAGSADLGSFYSAFGSDAAAAAKVTSEAIAGGISSVVGTLGEAGVDFSAVGNPMTAPLVAQTGSSAGNAYDQALDALGAKLTAAGTTQAQLAQAVVAAASGGSGSGTGAAEVRLLPEQLLQPAHPDCAALRSGTYRWIAPFDTFQGETAYLARRGQFDAPGLKMTWDGSSETSSEASNGNCTLTNGNGTRAVVSQAGFVVMTSGNGGSAQQLSFGFPEQTPNLADMTGTWNVVGFGKDGTSTGRVNTFSTATFAADGRQLGGDSCETGYSNCTAQAGPFGALRVNTSAGGFDYVFPDGRVSDKRFFVYRPASGEPSVLIVSIDWVAIATRQRAASLPAVGDVLKRWDASSNAAGVATPSFSDATQTITAVDPLTQSYTRVTQQNGVANTFRLNQPHAGLSYRAPGSTVNNSGSTVTISEIYATRLPGTGVSVYGRVTTTTDRSQGFWGLSIDKPAGAPDSTNWGNAGSGGNTSNTLTMDGSTWTLTTSEMYVRYVSAAGNNAPGTLGVLPAGYQLCLFATLGSGSDVSSCGQISDGINAGANGVGNMANRMVLRATGWGPSVPVRAGWLNTANGARGYGASFTTDANGLVPHASGGIKSLDVGPI